MAVRLDRPSALILCAQIAALALARRLGRAGIGVGVWDVAPMEGVAAPPAAHSRYVRWRLTGLGREEAAWADQLITVAQGLGERPALIATSDETLLLISRHRARLQPFYRLLLPAAETLELLLDKRRLHEEAARRGVAVPRSIPLASARDLDPALRELGLPCLLKSAYGKVGNAAGDAALPGKIKIESREQLHRQYASLSACDTRWLLQEYLPGGAERVALYNAYFDAQHQPRAVFTGRKLRQYPVDYGTASLSQACLIPGLAEPLTAFLQQLDYVGPVDIGLKWDARQRVYKLLDVNPRLGQNYRTFVAYGHARADLGWLTYAELAELPLKLRRPLRARPRRWKIEDHDWRSCRELHRRGELSMRAWLADWARWHCGRHERAYWSWQDPRPLLWQLAHWRRQRAAATPPPAARPAAARGVLL
jgi:predicted ATP-grasp superfamily ATP-dependent carboligase